MKPTKAERRMLRELAGLAYDAEAGEALGKLEGEFRRWRERAIGPDDLIHAIHQFHQHAARDLFNTYSLRDERLVVMRAVARGYVREDQIPDPLRTMLQEQIDIAREADPRD